MSNSERAIIVEAARKWIGTPYIHQASALGKGADCLGLVRGVWREVVGPEPEELPAYTPDWGEISHRETMLEVAHRHFDAVNLAQTKIGNILIFRWKAMNVAKHAGILSGEHRFIHAYGKAGVVESNLGQQWRSRLVAAFKFPQIET